MNNFYLLKRRCLNLSILLVFSIAFITSCKKDKNNESEIASVSETNHWVLDSMKAYYYWSSTLPVKPDFTKDPESFFESILSTSDRFSWIQKKEDLEKSLSGITKDAGFDFFLLRKTAGSSDLVGLIKIITEDSPASKAGLSRGQIFTKINGTTITETNYQNLLSVMFTGNSYSITPAENINGVITEKQAITLLPVEVQENPIHEHLVLTSRTGKKIGYLFYSQFLDEYDDDLLSVFGEFKSAGVTELIIDLRYNPGGSVASAALLAGLIQPAFSGNDVFIEFQGNSNVGSESYTYNDIFGVSNINVIKGINLNLSNVYILATGGSASASELLINNLRPVMNVVHIGETTVGKNEASITIYDQRTPPKVEWAIQPIVFRTANKNGFGDYAAGLTPATDDIIDELDLLPLEPFGSVSDPLIARALNRIDPGTGVSAARRKTFSMGSAVADSRSRKISVMTVDDILKK